jgi:hypothetical protein
MKILSCLFSYCVKRVLTPQRNAFILELILCLSVLIHSITGLAKQLPELVESIVKLLGVFS